MALLGAREPGVEPSQLRIRQVRSEQGQPLLAPRLDQRGNQEPIEQPLPRRLPHQRLQALRIRIPRVTPERQPALLHHRQHLREMARFLAGEPGHRARQSRHHGERGEHRQRLRCRLLLAMSVVDQHLVEALESQFHPLAGRVAEKSHRPPYTAAVRIGVISDTHGLLRPQVRDVFRGVDHILHAGDIGGEEVLAELGAIADVTACAGNNDGWRCGPAGKSARVSLGGLRFLIVHIRDDARAELQRAPADVVVFGHSHKPVDEREDRIWWFNPGSAGPRRFSLPVCVGLFERLQGKWQARHVALQ